MTNMQVVTQCAGAIGLALIDRRCKWLHRKFCRSSTAASRPPPVVDL